MAGKTSTSADLRKEPLILNLSKDSPPSVLISYWVFQEFMRVRYLRPSDNSKVPPLDQELFCKTAKLTSFSCAWIMIFGRQKPTRLNIHLPSALSAVANEFHALRKRKVAASSPSACNSYSILKVCGCIHLDWCPINSITLFIINSPISQKILLNPELSPKLYLTTRPAV